MRMSLDKPIPRCRSPSKSWRGNPLILSYISEGAGLRKEDRSEREFTRVAPTLPFVPATVKNSGQARVGPDFYPGPGAVSGSQGDI